MSWLFSQALVAEYSEAICLDGEQFAQLNVMPTQHKFWRNDKPMDASSLSRFGLTCAVLTDDHGAALLTWFLEASRVRTYQLPGMVPASMASAPDCGEKWQESSVKYDLDSSLWRTHRCLWHEDLPWSSVTLPTWGMTRSGFVFRHPTAERPINATGSGLWPTPRAADHKGSPNPQAALKARARGYGPNLPEAVAESTGGGTLNPAWVEWLMGWPIGWTDLKPLAMDRFRKWLQQHSGY